MSPVGPEPARFLLGAQPNLKQALCRGADPADNPWFPDPRIKGYQARIGHAKETCAICPEHDACLRWALDNYELGVWGGTDAEDRKKIRLGLSVPTRKKRDKPIPHGTVDGYKAETERRLAHCEPCKTAWAEAGGEYRQRRAS